MSCIIHGDVWCTCPPPPDWDKVREDAKAEADRILGSGPFVDILSKYPKVTSKQLREDPKGVQEQAKRGTVAVVDDKGEPRLLLSVLSDDEPSPTADYARGRADGIAAALSAVRTHWAKSAERQHVPGLRLAIETLEKMR